MSAVKKEKESEIVSLLNGVKDGISSESFLADAFLKQGQQASTKCKGLIDVVADHMDAFCRGALRKKERIPLDRVSIEKRYPYTEFMRDLPYFESRGDLSDADYRVAMLIGGILKGPCALKEGSSDWNLCMREWRMLFYSGPIAVN